MPPEISIIAPHLNQPAYLAAFLEALHAQDFDMGRAEVIVVDNGSDVLPREVVAPYPGVVLASEAVPGPGPARNRGVALSRAPILAFADADCLVARDWAAAILARFKDPDLAAIGGDIRVFARDWRDPTPAEAYDCVYAFPQAAYIARQNFAVTANLAVRRSVFEAVGPFAGIEVAEDTDWGQRAAAMGYRTIWAPEVVVRHPARQTMDELYAKWDRNVSHHFEAFAQDVMGRAKWAVKAAAMGISPLAEIPRLATTDRLTGLRARRRAFGALARVRLYRAKLMVSALAGGAARQGNRSWNRP